MRRNRLLDVTVDVCLAVVAAAVGAGLELADADVETKTFVAPVWTYVAAQVLAGALLLARRRWPYAVTLTIAVIDLAVPAWATLMAAYAVMAYGGASHRRRWAAVGLLAVAFLTGAHAWAIQDPVTAPVVILCCALLGLYTRARWSLLAELTDRAERAERERLLLAEQARADERIRLAGEMHDVVTHRINLMVLQAGALRVSAPDPVTRAAAEDLRAAGCQALAELRDLVGVLRNGGGLGSRDVRDADPADDDLGALMDESRAVGLPVRLELSGDRDRPAPTVRRTVFRVVQESLTNVRKHAPGANALVTVAYGPDAVRVSVSNDAPAHPPDPDLVPVGGGSGLAGLRHRVELTGGALTAGTTADGGFTVSATLPCYVPTAVSR